MKNYLDSFGYPIERGNVLRHVGDGVTGVVVQIIQKGDVVRYSGPCDIGDMVIVLDPGYHRITNKYHEWEHVPRDEQTFKQRYFSWMHTNHGREYQDTEPDMEYAEYVTVEGIIGLLPPDMLDEDCGRPDCLKSALLVLVEYMKRLATGKATEASAETKPKTEEELKAELTAAGFDVDELTESIKAIVVKGLAEMGRKGA